MSYEVKYTSRFKRDMPQRLAAVGDDSQLIQNAYKS